MEGLKEGMEMFNFDSTPYEQTEAQIREMLDYDSERNGKGCKRKQVFEKRSFEVNISLKNRTIRHILVCHSLKFLPICKK